MTAPFSNVGKQVLANGVHYADAADVTAAEHIVARLNGEANGWLPIESAPENGKCIVWCATDDGGEMRVLDRNTRGHWLYEGEATFSHSFYIEPTHWRPLPDKPIDVAA